MDSDLSSALIINILSQFDYLCFSSDYQLISHDQIFIDRFNDV